MTDADLLNRLKATGCPQTIDQLTDASGEPRAVLIPLLHQVCDAGQVRLVRPASEFAYEPVPIEEPAHV